MDTLADTNVLLRSLDAGHPQNALAIESTSRVSAGGHLLVVSTQNLVELWSVATRPTSSNGLGLTLSEAAAALALIERNYVRLPDDHDGLYREWRSLISRFGVSGK